MEIAILKNGANFLIKLSRNYSKVITDYNFKEKEQETNTIQVYFH